MTTLESAPVPVPTPTRRSLRAAAVRWYYPGVALLLLAMALWGFKDFYFAGRAYPDRPITPPIRVLVIAHGVAMMAWMLLFAVQPTLIAVRKRRVHMTLGLAGVGLAACVVVLGMLIGVYSARVAPPDFVLWTLLPKQFAAVPLCSVTLFGVFVAVGVRHRRKPKVHRPMMLCATFSVMAAAIGRIGPLNDLYLGTTLEHVFGPFLFAQVLMGLVLVVHRVLTGSFEKWLWIGFGVLTVASPLIMVIGRTGVWESFMSLFVA